MYEILYFLNVIQGKVIAVAGTTKINVQSGSFPNNTKFVWHSETILLFKHGKFDSVLKSRYKSTDELAQDMQNTTIEEVMENLRHWKLAFMVDQELEIIGNFSNPYIVYKSLQEEYELLHHEVKMERMKTYEIRTTI